MLETILDNLLCQGGELLVESVDTLEDPINGFINTTGLLVKIPV